MGDQKAEAAIVDNKKRVRTMDNKRRIRITGNKEQTKSWTKPDKKGGMKKWTWAEAH